MSCPPTLVRGQQLTAFSADLAAREAFARLEKEGFDVAPIAGVPICRYVRREDLAGGGEQPIAAFARDIEDLERLPERTSLSETLRVLRERPYVFVHHREHITGLITHADVGQPPVNLLALGMILSLENALDQLIQREARDDAWLELLSDERRQVVELIYDQRQQANTHLGRINCLSVSDRMDLARKLKLATVLGFDSNEKLKDWKEQVRDVRDTLAHSGTLLNAVPDAPEALAMLDHISRVAWAAWRAVECR